MSPESGLAHSADAPLVFALVLPLLLAVVLAEISEGGLDVKAVAMLGVLSAVGAALRPLGAGTAGLETVFFLLVLGGRVFGPGFGFVQGAVTLFGSALITGGVGPWLPFQMLGAAWVGWGAGLLPRARGRREVALLAAYGAVAGLAYGMLLNLSFWPFTTGQDGALSLRPRRPADREPPPLRRLQPRHEPRLGPRARPDQRPPRGGHRPSGARGAAPGGPTRRVRAPRWSSRTPRPTER